MTMLQYNHRRNAVLQWDAYLESVSQTTKCVRKSIYVQGFFMTRRKTETGKAKLGLYVRPDLKTAYDAACRGNISEGFLGAAIVWIGLPAEIREAAMTNGKTLPVDKAVEATRKALMHRMSDMEIEQAIRAMPKAEKIRFLRETRSRRREP
jgi:hypothetical protein